MDNLDELAEQIFGQPVRPPHSVQLQLEDATADIAEQEGVENFVFNILYLLTHKGMKILYGDRKMSDLTEAEFNVIQAYVNSFGYTIIVLANGTTRSPWSLLREGIPLRNYIVMFEPL